MQLGINNQILILGSQKEKTSRRKAARGLKMDTKRRYKATSCKTGNKSCKMGENNQKYDS